MGRSKGLVLKDLIILIVMLVMFAASIVIAINSMSKEAREQKAMMSANEIAGIINMMQASPKGTFHAVSLEKSCTVSVTPESVTVTLDKVSKKAGVIKTSLIVEPKTLQCKDGAAYVMRCEDTIKVSQRTRPCES